MKVLKNVLFWTATVVLVIAIMAVAVPKLFGVEFRAVLTGSMEPEIPVGSLVVIVPTKSDDIEIGDNITFVTESNKVVTHKVIEVDRENELFTTYGVANGINNRDPANRYENILGVVKVHIPVIGQGFVWLASTTGKIITVTAIVAVYIVSMLISLIFGKKDETEPEDEEVQVIKGIKPERGKEFYYANPNVKPSVDIEKIEELRDYHPEFENEDEFVGKSKKKKIKKTTSAKKENIKNQDFFDFTMDSFENKKVQPKAGKPKKQVKSKQINKKETQSDEFWNGVG